MAIRDIMISVGPKWGQQVPLGEIMDINMVHLEEYRGKYTVRYETDKVKRKSSPMVKRAAYNNRDLLLTLKSGIIPENILQQILKQREDIIEHLGEEKALMIKTLADLEHAIATVEKKPFLHFTLKYDHKKKQFVHTLDFTPQMAEMADELLSEDEREVASSTLSTVAMMLYEPVADLIEAVTPGLKLEPEEVVLRNEAIDES